LRVTHGIKENFEDVSLDMMMVLLWVQQTFPNFDGVLHGNISLLEDV